MPSSTWTGRTLAGGSSPTGLRVTGSSITPDNACYASKAASCPTVPTPNENAKSGCQMVLFVMPFALQQPPTPLKLPKRCGRQSVGHPSASSPHATTGDRIRRSASLSFLATEQSPLQQGHQRAAKGLLPLNSLIVESNLQPIRSATMCKVGPRSKGGTTVFCVWSLNEGCVNTRQQCLISGSFVDPQSVCVKTLGEIGKS